jgi:hypothetical protein
MAGSRGQNPITVSPGQIQRGVDPKLLLPSRKSLDGARLAFQRRLIQTIQPRLTPILVTPDGVIYDGHHAVRAAAETGSTVEVLVVGKALRPCGLDILAVPVR